MSVFILVLYKCVVLTFPIKVPFQCAGAVYEKLDNLNRICDSLSEKFIALHPVVIEMFQSRQK